MMIKNSSIQQSPSEKTALEKNGFRLVSKLGQGGYGKVYLAEYNSIKSNQKLKLACKIIHTARKKEKNKLLVLPQELEIITKLSHPHIIQIHSIFQRKDLYYIFMRYAENGDLLDYVINNGPVENTLAKIWTRQIALAIQYLHVLEIAHRDIKCENILITISNNIKIADFGFARNAIDNNNHIVLSDTYCGSVSYASPQILIGEPYYPKVTDMWSFGCVLYVMLNKGFPFDSKNMKVMINDQLAKNYKFRTKYASKYGNEAQILVSGLLEPNEHARMKIDDVIKSKWITMNASLRALTRREYSALAHARVIANSNYNKNASTKPNIKINPKNTVRSVNNKKPSAAKQKNIDDGFDLSSINSSINTHKRLST